MKKSIVVLLCVFLFLACKAKKNTVESAVAPREVVENLKVKDIVTQHELAFPDFSTLSGSAVLSFSKGETTETLPSFSFRMEKDKAIWFSAPLGVAKALITPDKVSFYNRMDNSHFEGDFSYVSDLLGVDVDFISLQNILLGQSVRKLSKKTELLELKNDQYLLRDEDSSGVALLYGIVAGSYRVGFLAASKEMMNMRSEYTYQNVNGVILPAIVKITTQKIEGNQVIEENKIDLQFKGVSVNEKVTFPYKIPSGSKAIN